MDFVSAIVLQDTAVAGTLISGTVQIEPGVWNMISIPSAYGEWNATTHQLDTTVAFAKVKNYVIDQLMDKYPTCTIVRCSRYWGDDNSYRDYIPGVTPESSAGNFELMPLDTGSGLREMVGFWLFINHTTVLNLEWTSWL
jgi:hypothetical protein